MSSPRSMDDSTILTENPQLELLKQAVDKFDQDGGPMPWKKMSQWMKKKGCSYEFAPATCAKKWAEVEGEL